MMTWFIGIYIFGCGFLVGIITAGFIISDWLYEKVRKLEDWFAMRKLIKLSEEERKQFEGIQ
ncbi:unnamed protein product, partial [marine sediment metagenome]